MRVAVTVVRCRGLDPRRVRGIASRMLRSLDQGDAELSVVLCDDELIRQLNGRFANEDHATDVLAFASAEGPGPRTGIAALGDVVISIETARRQAKARRSTLEEEVGFLLAHGLLHLLGWDHRYAAEARAMTSKTAELVEASRAVRGRRRRTAERRTERARPRRRAR